MIPILDISSYGPHADTVFHSRLPTFNSENMAAVFITCDKLFGLVLHMRHIIGASQGSTDVIITSQGGTILLLQMQRQRREVTCQGHTVGRC